MVATHNLYRHDDDPGHLPVRVEPQRLLGPQLKVLPIFSWRTPLKSYNAYCR